MNDSTSSSTVTRTEIVDTTITRLYCNCGEEMQANGRVLLTSPPQYCYCCPACGAGAVEQILYPVVGYRGWTACV